MALKDIPHIVVHGTNGDGAWCGLQDLQLEGITVYHRSATSEGGDFDISLEGNFETKTAAEIYVAALQQHMPGIEVFRNE